MGAAALILILQAPPRGPIRPFPTPHSSPRPPRARNNHCLFAQVAKACLQGREPF